MKMKTRVIYFSVVFILNGILQDDHYDSHDYDHGNRGINPDIYYKNINVFLNTFQTHTYKVKTLSIAPNIEIQLSFESMAKSVIQKSNDRLKFLYRKGAAASCGVVRHEKPAVRGKYIRLVLTPSKSPGTGQMPTWFIYRRGWEQVEDVAVAYNTFESNGKFILDLKINTDDTSIHLFTKLRCWTSTYTVDLNDTTAGAACGVIRHEEPAIRGRHVRLVFTPPDSSSTGQTPQWYIYKRRWITLEQIAMNYNASYRNGDFILDLQTNTDDNSVDVSANWGCRPYQVKLEELDFDKCGKLYLQPQKFRPDSNIKIRYIPHKSIEQNPRHFNQTWRVMNTSCPEPKGCVISEQQGMFKMTKGTFYNYPEYFLEIKLMNRDKDGDYLLQCSETQTTDSINVHTPVKPSQPRILNQRMINGEGGYIVGYIGNYTLVECETYNGTDPEVKISVETIEQHVTTSSSKYSVRVLLTENLHKTTIRCEVTSRALDSPLSTQSKLYVAVWPTRPAIHKGDVKEGEPVNVSCSSQLGRPVSSLKLSISSINDTDISTTSSVINQAGNTRTASIRLNNMKRSWNGKTLQCCTASDFHTEQCSTARIDFKFPPEIVSIHHEADTGRIQQVYTIRTTCTMVEFSADCELDWKLDDSVMETIKVPYSQKTKNYTKTISTRVNKSDNGKQMTCSATCAGFTKQRSNVQRILVPYEPVVTLDTPSHVNVTEGEPLYVNCTADSHPVATITWRNELMHEIPNSTICGRQSACLRLGRLTETQSGLYICVAKNSLSGEITQQLNVNVQKRTIFQTSEQSDSDFGSSDLFIPAIVLAILVGIFVTIIVIFFVKKRRSATHKPTQHDTTTPGDADQPGTSARTTNGDNSDGARCYDVISDIKRHGNPLPQTQPQKRDAVAVNKNVQNYTNNKNTELDYVNLDLRTSSKSTSALSALRADPDVENFEIDLTKKDKPLPLNDIEEENEYAECADI